MEPAAATALPALTAPYVGLRPYERYESDLLTGRAKDARFLADKVFSARLTLLYSPSGLGKSSLLRALVIPELECEESRTLYLDAWGGEEPEMGVRGALQDLAASLGLAHVLGEAAPLVDWVRLVTADRRTLVLVLDQFEEFLLNHAQRLDPLRKELATLVRTPDLDLRMLVALREEFLANLEPFREEIVTLFQSTYRLEPLNSVAVREAIRAPAERFGVEYEPALLEQLVADLEARPATPVTGQGATAADLPMLQIVCLELWNAAAKKLLKTLTLDFYQKALGGAQAILGAYIRKVMPRRWRDRLFSARLMKYLAPPSGLKMSYAVSDLAAMSGLDPTRIEAELRRLAAPGVRIVRMREFRSGERFELQHDALIPRIAPWRDRELARYVLLKRGGWLAISVLAVVVGVGLKLWLDAHDMYLNTEKRLEKVCRDPQEAETIFNQVTSYLLGHKRGEAAWDRLPKLMQDYERCMPESYGIDTSGYGVIQLVPPEEAEAWPLVLRLGEEREFDETAFMQSWYRAAASLTERWGVPLPRRAAIVRDPSFPRNLVRLESNRKTMVEMEIPQPAGAALVRLGDDSPVVARAFHEHFREKWTPWKPSAQQESPGDWWVVPRWSLPAWKAAGVKAYYPSAAVALGLETRLQSEPGGLLTDNAVRYLLARLADNDLPNTANEAGTAYCAGLDKALASLLAAGQGLSNLRLVIDGLIGIHPDRWPEAVKTFAQHDYLATLKLISGETLSRPGSDRRTECDPTVWKVKDSRLVAYREMEPWLPPPMAASIRVLIGEELVRSWAPDGKNLAPWVKETIDESRDLFYERMGVPMPGIRYRATSLAEPAGPLEFKLGLLDRKEALQPAGALPGGDRKNLQTLLDAIILQVQAASAAWVYPEDVKALVDGLNPELQKWLKEHYSVMDITRVLRAVLLPDSSDESGQPTANQSLRHPEWLLGALVAWDAAPGPHPHEVAAIADFLRKLQQARLDATIHAASPTAADPIAQAVGELFRNRIQSAQRRLAEEVQKSGADQVRERFVRLYAPGYRSVLLSHASDWCREPTQPSLQDLDRLRADLADLLSPGERPLPPELARRLRLCRVATYPSWRLDKQVSEAVALAMAGDRPDSWSPTHALWLGQKILKYYDPVRDPPQWRAAGGALLGSALRRLPDRERDEEFVDLLTLCRGSGPHTWCWNLARELAGQLQGDPWMAIDMADSLSDQAKTVGPERVFEWLTEGERRLKSAPLSEDERKHGLRWIRLIRANARLELAQPGDAETLAQLKQEFEQLSGLGKPFDEQAHVDLTRLLLDKQRAWEDAERSAWEGMQVWPENVDFYTNAFLAALMQDKQEAVQKVVKFAEDKAQKLGTDAANGDAFLFLAALGHLLTGEGRWELVSRQFLQTHHRYVNIVAMLLHNRMSGSAGREAKALIDARWRAIDPATWPRRMEEGDESAWTERLLSLYHGDVQPEDILQVLKDDKAYQASAFAKLPIAREGLLNDTYFYAALRQQSQKDFEGMKRSLRRVVEIGATDYFEFFMASYLLGHDQISRQQD
jgi:hypothetical protein